MQTNYRRHLRRAVLIAITCIGSITTAWTGDATAEEYLVHVGTYTGSSSKGVYAFRYSAGNGESSRAKLAAEALNPSFLVVHPSGKYLYAVNETVEFSGTPSGAVSAYAIDEESGNLQLLNQVPSGGADPCYIALDKTGKFILVANYTGGSVSVFPIRENGGLGEPTAVVRQRGSSGADPKRQQSPHAHSIDLTPDNRFALVADLGLDQILIFRFDAQTGSLTPHQPAFVRTRRGAGPRHVSFHPNGKTLFVLNELHSSVSAYEFNGDSGTLKHEQTISMLPSVYTGKKLAAEIQVHRSGKFLYSSNRGHDSIAVFAINAKGRLTPVERVLTGGKEPRFFTIDPAGKRLFAANQLSDTIQVFDIHQDTGKLTPAYSLEVPTPVALSFLPLAKSRSAERDAR